MKAPSLSSLELAFIDLARAGIVGDSDAARVLARRATRRIPEGVVHPALFKEALLTTLDLSKPVDTSPFRAAMPAAPAFQEGVWTTPAHAPVAAPVLPADVEAAVELLITEHSAAESLNAFGLAPARTVLFTGAPGLGKTLTAAFVASRLGAPLVTVNFAGLISSLLGQTGSNFQSVVQSALDGGAVLFLDEFDAIGKSRGDQHDLGEMKRVVNVVLQQLDSWPAGNLLIAATNHPELLDSAIFRRFDSSLAFTLPGLPERRRFLGGHDVLNRLEIDGAVRDAIAVLSDAQTLSSLDLWVKSATRKLIVGGNHARASEKLFEEARKNAARVSAEAPENRAVLARAAKALGWTQRKTADWLGVSHVTIGKDLRSA